MSTGPDWAGIVLGPLRSDDLATLHAWQNDPEVRDPIMGFRGPLQRETASAWIEQLRADNLRTRVVFGIYYSDVLKGVAQLHGIDWVHRTAAFGIYIGARSDRGAGLGFVASSLLLDYAFAALDLARVSLTVLAGNAATRLYERLGFVREGLLRQAFFLDGQREDVACYAMLRREWPGALPPGAHRLVSSRLTA